MGIWKTTTEAADALEDDLASKINEVAGEVGKSLDSAFDLFHRGRAPSIIDRGDSTASVGVWIQSAQTGSASQKQRKWQSQLVIDYTYRGQDRTEVAEQVELATDAIMRVVDDMVTRDTIAGAGEERGGTVSVHDIDDLVQEMASIGSSGPYKAATRIQTPVEQRETLP